MFVVSASALGCTSLGNHGRRTGAPSLTASPHEHNARGLRAVLAHLFSKADTASDAEPIEAAAEHAVAMKVNFPALGVDEAEAFVR